MVGAKYCLFGSLGPSADKKYKSLETALLGGSWESVTTCSWDYKPTNSWGNLYKAT